MIPHSTAYMVMRRGADGSWAYYAGRNEALGATRWSSLRADAVGMSKGRAEKIAKALGGFVGRA
jgi:hypothetical protein